MGKTQYVDTELLSQYISNSGLKIGYLAEQLGVTEQAFHKKRTGKAPFRAAEVYVLCDLCKISEADKPKIFCFEG